MGCLSQRQLTIIYILAWLWRKAKRLSVRKSLLKKGGIVKYARTKDADLFGATVLRRQSSGTYSIVYVNGDNQKRKLKNVPRNRLHAPPPSRMPNEWIDGFVELAGLARGRRGEVSARFDHRSLTYLWLVSAVLTLLHYFAL